MGKSHIFFFFLRNKEKRTTMSLIEIGETGSWLAHFFQKTVDSYAKKIAKLYYLSFFWILSSLTDNT